MTDGPSDALASAITDGLLDDAALFPPGSAPAATAVPAHRAWRSSTWADAVGPFVLRADDLDAVSAVMGTDDGPLEVSLAVPDGRLERALAAVMAAPRIAAVAVEAAAGSGQELSALAQALGDRLPLGIVGYLEAGWGTDPEAAADLAAAHGLMLKFRTGGTAASAFPSAQRLGSAIAAARAAGVGFKCTAGLHSAVAHVDPETGFAHHGFLNVLLAAAAADESAAREALGEQDEAVVVAAVQELGPSRVTDARSRFASFGTCDLAEPLEDLHRLGLLGAAPEGGTP